MQLHKTTLSILLILISITAAAEDVTDAFTKCAITDNNQQRLACYDKIGQEFVKKYKANQSQSASKYKSMDLLDLKTDIKTLKGQKVSVLGQVQMMGELAMLKANPMDMTPIILDITKLPRDDRKQMLKSCTVICDNVRVNGSVHPGMMGDTLIAEQVVWQ